MEKIKIEVRNPLALWHELRDVIDVHYCVATPQNQPFMRYHPELYHLYLNLSIESEEVRQEMKKTRTRKPWEEKR